MDKRVPLAHKGWSSRGGGFRDPKGRTPVIPQRIPDELPQVPVTVSVTHHSNHASAHGGMSSVLLSMLENIPVSFLLPKRQVIPVRHIGWLRIWEVLKDLPDPT